jgi:hypothetical protein
MASPPPETSAAPPATEDQTKVSEDKREEEAWVQRFGAQEEWIRFRQQVEYRSHSKEDEEAIQAVDTFKDYLKMVDGRKKRQTEGELCRLMCAWIVLKRRHERRQKKWNGTTKVSTPPRPTKPRIPRSPTNPMEETRQTSRSMIARTTFQAELRQHCLRQKKRILERELRSGKIKTHGVKFQGVLDGIRTEDTRKKAMARRAAAAWDDWQNDNQPAATANKDAKQSTLQKKAVSLRYKYLNAIRAADQVMQDAQEAIEQPFPWFGEYEADIADDNDDNHYFWHRGRPPEGDY